MDHMIRKQWLIELCGSSRTLSNSTPLPEKKFLFYKKNRTFSFDKKSKPFSLSTDLNEAQGFAKSIPDMAMLLD